MRRTPTKQTPFYANAVLSSKLEVRSDFVIEARNQSDVVGKILASIMFVFEVLQLPERPPPAFSPDPQGDRDDGSNSDAFCF